jgi:hypothetical protein
MLSIFRRPIAPAFLLVIGLLGTSARADLVVTVQEGAGPVQTFSDFGAPSLGLAAGAVVVHTANYTIDFLGGTADQNSTITGPSTTTQSEVLSSTTEVELTGATPGGTLHITVTGTGYTAPTAPPTVSTDSQIGGSVAATTSTNTLNFQSFVNGVGFGVQSPSIATKASYNSDMTGSLATLASGYSIKETIDITLKSKLDQVNYSSNTTLSQTIVQSVPEPSSMVLAGIGALGMIGFGLRRRKATGA